MRTGIAILGMLFVGFLPCFAQGNGAAIPKKVSVCMLAAHPGKYDHSLVVLNARIESDGHEFITLFDDGCRDDGVSLVEMHSSARIEAVKKLMHAIEQVYVWGDRSQNLTVTATITGYFYAKPRYYLPILMPVDAANIDIRKGVLLGPDLPQKKISP